MERDRIFSIKTYGDGYYFHENEYQLSQKFVSQLFHNEYDNSGWVKQPYNISEQSIQDIIDLAETVKKQCEVLIVIGIGGSFLGAKAIIDALKDDSNVPRIYFVGHTLSSWELQKALSLVKEFETEVCVVSKSGSTFETSITWSIIKKALIEKYGNKFSQNVVIITDLTEGPLRLETEKEGYSSLSIEKDIGGRYSAFTSSTLFPLAVAGLDIKKFIEGAKALASIEVWTKDIMAYCLARIQSQCRENSAEMIAVFEPRLRSFVEWIRQLFAESEGKQGKGLFPINLLYTQDLHSIGQYIQQGRQFFCETLIYVKNSNSIIIPTETGLGIGGKSLDSINEIACEAVIEAHSQNNIRIVRIDIDTIDEFNLGQLMYFYMMTAAVSGLLLGINPFDQPGVETYKRKITEIIECR